MATKKLPFDAAPPDELGHFNHHFSITMELEHHPFMAAMAIVAVGLILIYLFGSLARRNSAASALPATELGEPLPQSTQPFILASGENPLPVVVSNPPTSPIPVILPPPQDKPTPTPTPSPTSDVATPYVVVKSAGAILASTPGGTNNKGHNILTIPSGKKVHVTGSTQSFGSNHYYPVTYNSASGFVNANAVGPIVYS